MQQKQDIDAYQRNYPRHKEIAFDSKKKYMISIHAYENEYSPHFQQGFQQNRPKTRGRASVENSRNRAKSGEKGKNPFVKGFWNIHFAGFSTFLWETLLKVVILTKFSGRSCEWSLAVRLFVGRGLRTPRASLPEGAFAGAARKAGEEESV